MSVGRRGPAVPVGRIDSLTSLRFFAALGVLLHHLDFLGRSENEGIRFAFTVFFEGFNGVTFFFILSGFIISYSFTEKVRDGDLSMADFVFFRLARLYPTHLLTLATAIVAYGYWDFLFLDFRLVANVLLVQAMVPELNYYFGYNGVSWSISAELMFYLMFCLVALAKTRALIYFWVVLFGLVAINLLAFGVSGPVGGWLVYINPVFRFLDFLTGMLIFRLFSVWKLEGNTWRFTLFEVACLVLLVIFTGLGALGYVSYAYRTDVYYILPMALSVFVFAHNRGHISRLLAWRPFVLLGEASFALYMIHQIVIITGTKWFVAEPVNDVGMAWLAAGILLGVSVVLSVGIYLLFERPVNFALRRLWAARKKNRLPQRHRS